MPRVIMISYFFPPIGGIVSERSVLFSRLLAEHGWEPVVVTPRLGTLRTIEAGEGLDVGPGVRVTRTGNPDLEFRVKRLLGFDVSQPVESQLSLEHWGSPRKDLSPRLVRTLKNWLELPDRMADWTPFALRAAKRIAAEGKVDAIYSMSPPYTSALVAARLSAATGIPWVMDLPDTWTLDFTYFKQDGPARLDRRLEGYAVSKAAAVVTISQQYSDAITARYPFLAGRVSVIPNAYDGDLFSRISPLETDGLNMVYAGTVNHPYQDLTPFMQALASLKRGGTDLSGFRFQYLGRDARVVGELSRAAGVEELVDLIGQVPYTESLARQKGAAALLYVQWEPGGGAAATGKLIQYVGARRPILALAPSGGEARRVVEQTQAGCVAADARETAAVLERWLQAYRENGELSCASGNGVVESLSYRAAATSLAAVLEAVAANGRHAG